MSYCILYRMLFEACCNKEDKKIYSKYGYQRLYNNYNYTIKKIQK